MGAPELDCAGSGKSSKLFAAGSRGTAVDIGGDFSLDDDDPFVIGCFDCSGVTIRASLSDAPLLRLISRGEDADVGVLGDVDADCFFIIIAGDRAKAGLGCATGAATGDIIAVD